jgi:hypothetical protein
MLKPFKQQNLMQFKCGLNFELRPKKRKAHKNRAKLPWKGQAKAIHLFTYLENTCQGTT